MYYECQFIILLEFSMMPLFQKIDNHDCPSLQFSTTGCQGNCRMERFLTRLASVNPAVYTSSAYCVVYSRLFKSVFPNKYTTIGWIKVSGSCTFLKF